MILLLDTHATLWWLRGSSKVPQKVRESVWSGTHEVFVSSVVAFELSTKFRIGKLPEARDLLVRLDLYLEESGFTPLSISMEHARVAGLLPGPHRDPFDRLLIAQAKIEGATIVSADPVFAAYDVPTLW